MDDFMPATVVGYSEWPKNTPNYWALPAMGDVGRLDLPQGLVRQARAAGGIQGEVRPRPRRRPRPATSSSRSPSSSRGREIDGKKVYGASIYTERGSEGITMGVTQRALRLRLQVREPEEALRHGRLRQLRRARSKGLEFYKALYKCCTPPGRVQRLHGRRPRRLQVRPGGDADELSPSSARACYKDPNVGGDKIGFFVNPAGPNGDSSPSSAARASRWSPTPTSRTTALEYIKWFAQPDVQKKWWALGGYSCLKAVLNDPGFPTSQPYAQTFLDSMAIVKDFWAEPTYAAAAAGHAEARARLRRRRQGHGARKRSTVWSRTGPKVFKDDGKM